MSTEAPLSAEALAPLLAEAGFTGPVHWAAVADSTQTLALQAARRGAPEFSVFFAETQTAGRGRHGHSWESPPGAGIYASLLLRPQLPPALTLPLTLAAALALADAVRECAGVRPDIRWPNDLLLEGKKFCGILIETAQDGDGSPVAVVGFGINVHQRSFPPPLDQTATALGLHAQVSRARLAVAAVNHLRRRYAAFQSDTLRRGDEAAAQVVTEFETSSSYARGMEVEVMGGDPEGYRGRTEGLDRSGFLRVRLGDGTLRTVLSGDVRPARL